MHRFKQLRFTWQQADWGVLYLGNLLKQNLKVVTLERMKHPMSSQEKGAFELQKVVCLRTFSQFHTSIIAAVEFNKMAVST